MSGTTTFGQKAFLYHTLIRPPHALPKNIGVLNPFENKETLEIVAQFYTKYFSDIKGRTALFGINPGRYGGGITGLSFTDPVVLEKHCGIPNLWPKKNELSSGFIYEVILAFGGVSAFFSQYYLTALSPLGYVKDGTNLNYYDIVGYKSIFFEYCAEEIKKQIEFGINRKIAFCIGMGKNLDFFSELNNTYHFFDEIKPLAHPRWILQYKRKRKANYLEEYVNELNQIRMV